MKRFVSCAAILTAVLLSLTAVAGAAPATGKVKKGSILLVCCCWDNNAPYRQRFYERHLNDQGYDTAIVSFNGLSDDMIRKFNLIMMLDFARIKEGLGDQYGVTSARYQDELAVRLERYVKDGGGVMFFAIGPITGVEGIAAQNRLLKKWGAEYLIEHATDSAMSYVQKGYFGNTYYPASKITRSPITEGVKKIWYTQYIQIGLPTDQPLTLITRSLSHPPN